MTYHINKDREYGKNRGNSKLLKTKAWTFFVNHGLHHGSQIVSLIGKDIRPLTGAQDGILSSSVVENRVYRNVLFTLYLLSNLNGKST